VVYKDQFNSFRLGLTSSISTSGAAFPTVNDLESLSIQIISWRSEENGGGGETYGCSREASSIQAEM
jgi:hypothetical protein